jgi:hypothetical protein
VEQKTGKKQKQKNASERAKAKVTNTYHYQQHIPERLWPLYVRTLRMLTYKGIEHNAACIQAAECCYHAQDLPDDKVRQMQYKGAYGVHGAQGPQGAKGPIGPERRAELKSMMEFLRDEASHMGTPSGLRRVMLFAFTAAVGLFLMAILTGYPSR